MRFQVQKNISLSWVSGSQSVSASAEGWDAHATDFVREGSDQPRGAGAGHGHHAALPAAHVAPRLRP